MTYRIPIKGEKFNKPSQLFLYTVYGVDYCPYCKKAFSEITNLNNKEQKTKGRIFVFSDPSLENKEDLFKYLQKNHKLPKSHRTFPIVYKKDKYLGGSSDLLNDLEENN